MFVSYSKMSYLKLVKKLIILTLLCFPCLITILTLKPSNKPNNKLLGSPPLPPEVEELKNRLEIKPPGVIVQADSNTGLGNQLFRYACSFALAKKLQVPLYIWDPEMNKKNNSQRDKILEDPFARKYVLDKFHIPPENFIPKSSSFYNQTDVHYFNDVSLFNNTIKRNSYVAKYKLLIHEDYCQSETFFKDYEDQIRKHLVPKIKPSSIVEKWSKLIQQVNGNDKFVSVGIHVRRGDYFLGNRKKEYWVTPISYFRSAMDLMQKKYPEKTLKFFVFSDDIDYVRRNLLLLNGTTNSSNSNAVGTDWKLDNFFSISSNEKEAKRMNSLEEFYLMMSFCRNLIVSNSTFSWWAAYLIPNKDKVIIGPRFHPKFYTKYKSKTIRMFKELVIGKYWYPPGWIVIDPYVNISDSNNATNV